MIRVNTKFAGFIQSLEKMNGGFDSAMLQASRNIMRYYMTLVIAGTPKPGDSDEGFNKVYVRTGRLVGGWAPAAAALGLPATGGGDGEYRESVSPERIRLTATNLVHYAEFVERIGPWIIPPNAPGGPRFAGGRHMVENARNNTLGLGVIGLEVGKAWKRLRQS